MALGPVGQSNDTRQRVSVLCVCVCVVLTTHSLAAGSAAGFFHCGGELLSREGPRGHAGRAQPAE